MIPDNTLDDFSAATPRDIHAPHSGANRNGLFLAERGDMLREQTRHAAGTVRHQAHAAQQRTARYVADEPMKLVLLAAAAGALVTALVLFFGARRRH